MKRPMSLASAAVLLVSLAALAACAPKPRIDKSVKVARKFWVAYLTLNEKRMKALMMEDSWQELKERNPRGFGMADLRKVEEAIDNNFEGLQVDFSERGRGFYFVGKNEQIGDVAEVGSATNEAEATETEETAETAVTGTTNTNVVGSAETTAAKKTSGSLYEVGKGQYWPYVRYKVDVSSYAKETRGHPLLYRQWDITVIYNPKKGRWYVIEVR